MSIRRRIFLADDHALVRAGIRALLDTIPGMDVIGEAGDGQAALDAVRREVPDAILLDVTLPGLNGLDLAQRINQLGLGTRVLMLSMHAGPEYVARALAAGARGYLLKDAAFDELEVALQTVFSGGRYLSRGIDAAVVKRFEQEARRGGGELEVLTPRQRQILQLIAEGCGTRNISERLHVSIKTVEAHRAQIMDRLGIHDVPGLVRFAIRTGLVDPEG
jgi:DNA-binding NarL/FixJ family response regulator